MKRAVVVVFTAGAMLVSSVSPAWSYDRVFKRFSIDAIDAATMQVIIVLSLVASQNPPDECRQRVPVQVDRRVDGEWVKQFSARTNRRGRISRLINRRRGRYRATARRFITESNFECFEATSPTVTAPQ